MPDNPGRIQVGDLAAPERFAVSDVMPNPYVRPMAKPQAGAQLMQIADALSNVRPNLEQLFTLVSNDYKNTQAATGKRLRYEAKNRGENPDAPPSELNQWGVPGWEEADAVIRADDYFTKAGLALENSELWQKENASPEDLKRVLDPIRQQFMDHGKGAGPGWSETFLARAQAADHNLLAAWSNRMQNNRKTQAIDGIKLDFRREWMNMLEHLPPTLTEEQAAEVAKNLQTRMDALGTKFSLTKTETNRALAEAIHGAQSETAWNPNTHDKWERAMMIAEKYPAGTGPLLGIYPEIRDGAHTQWHNSEAYFRSGGSAKLKQAEDAGLLHVNDVIAKLGAEGVRKSPDVSWIVKYATDNKIDPLPLLHRFNTVRKALTEAQSEGDEKETNSIILEARKAKTPQDINGLRNRLDVMLDQKKITQDSFFQINTKLTQRETEMAHTDGGLYSHHTYTSNQSGLKSDIDSTSKSLVGEAKARLDAEIAKNPVLRQAYTKQRMVWGSDPSNPTAQVGTKGWVMAEHLVTPLDTLQTSDLEQQAEADYDDAIFSKLQDQQGNPIKFSSLPEDTKRTYVNEARTYAREQFKQRLDGRIKSLTAQQEQDAAKATQKAEIEAHNLELATRDFDKDGRITVKGNKAVHEALSTRINQQAYLEERAGYEEANVAANSTYTIETLKGLRGIYEGVPLKYYTKKLAYFDGTDVPEGVDAWREYQSRAKYLNEKVPELQAIVERYEPNMVSALKKGTADKKANVGYFSGNIQHVSRYAKAREALDAIRVELGMEAKEALKTPAAYLDWNAMRLVSQEDLTNKDTMKALAEHLEIKDQATADAFFAAQKKLLQQNAEWRNPNAFRIDPKRPIQTQYPMRGYDAHQDRREYHQKLRLKDPSRDMKGNATMDAQIKNGWSPYVPVDLNGQTEDQYDLEVQRVGRDFAPQQ